MHRHNSFWLLLISVGIVFLLNTFLIMPWEIWNILWTWWPIIVIFSGLDMIAEQSHGLQRIVVLIEILILLAILLSLTNSQSGYRPIPGLPKEV